MVIFHLTFGIQEFLSKSIKWSAGDEGESDQEPEGGDDPPGRAGREAAGEDDHDHDGDDRDVL